MATIHPSAVVSPLAELGRDVTIGPFCTIEAGAVLGDGCRLDRNIKEIVTAQPFSAVDSKEFCLEKVPKTHGYAYRGIATK